MPWYARQRLTTRKPQQSQPVDIAGLARRIAASLPVDPHAAAHVAALDHYTATPRKRTA